MPKVIPAVTPGLSKEMDTSIQGWIYNISHVLGFPFTILGVIGLIVAGTFAEIAPRKSLDFLNNNIGSALFFLIPLIIAYLMDWATGVLAAVVALIFFARLQINDETEGFTGQNEGFMDDLTTELIPTSKRWFVEKVLGETPIAISSDRIRRGYPVDQDTRTSSSSSMATTGSSDSSSHK